MICFLDRSFCSSDCVNAGCSRCLTPALQKRAQNWWGKGQPPVAFADFKSGCLRYQKPNCDASATADSRPLAASTLNPHPSIPLSDKEGG